MLFADDSTPWPIVIGAIFLGLTQLFSMWLTYRQNRDKLASDKAAADEAGIREEARVERERIVAEKAAAKAAADAKANKEHAEALLTLTDTATKTFNFANSAMGVALKINLDSVVEKLDKNPSDPELIRAVREAKERYEGHMAAQAANDLADFKKRA
jgi:hypothetical protein